MPTDSYQATLASMSRTTRQMWCSSRTAWSPVRLQASGEGGQDAAVELVQADGLGPRRGEVVGRGGVVEHAVQGAADLGVQAERGEVRAPGEQVGQGEPGAGRVRAAAARAVRRRAVRGLEQPGGAEPGRPAGVD